jgi:hypothetical protein
MATGNIMKAKYSRQQTRAKKKKTPMLKETSKQKVSPQITSK